MLLSLILFSSRSTPGLQWIGKHRRVRKITRQMKRNARLREQAADHVLQIISRPYLINVEEAGSGVGKETRKTEFMRKMAEYRNEGWLRRQHIKRRKYDTQLDQQYTY